MSMRDWLMNLKDDEKNKLVEQGVIPQGFVSQLQSTPGMENAQVVPPPQVPVPVIETPAPAPVPAAPVESPQESGFDWNSLGDAIGVGISGIGDAYSAAAGRNTSFGKNALEMVQNKQKLERDQAEKERENISARQLLKRYIPQMTDDELSKMDASTIKTFIPLMKPKTETEEVFGYTRDGQGNIYYQGKKVDPKTVPAGAKGNIFEMNEVKIGNQSIDSLLIDPKKKEEAFTKTGDEFLKYVKPEFRSSIMGVAQAKTLPNQLLSTRFGGAENLFSLASQYAGTPIDTTIFGAKQSTRKDFTSGKTGNNIKALNTAIGHLDTLKTAGQELKNNNVQGLNRLSNWIATQTGKPAPVKFDAIKSALSGEMAAVLKASGATDQEISHIAETINSKQSPQQLGDVADMFTDIMRSRLGAIKGQWDSIMGDEKFSFVYPKTKKILEKYGYDENMEKITGNQSSPVEVKSKEEALALPVGTKFLLNGRIGTVQ